MDLLKTLRAFLTKVYKKSDGELDELFKKSEDDITTELTAWDKERIKNAGPKEGQTFQDGYKKGKKESLELFEKDLREEFEIEDSDLQGKELVNAIVTAKTNSAQADPKKLTDDQVKAHPAYQALETQRKKELKAANEDWQKKYTELETGHKKEQTFSNVAKKALEERNKLNPVIPGTPLVAQSIEEGFLNSLKGYEWEEVDGKPLAKKDGKVLQDEHGNTLGFEDIVKNTSARFYEFKANNGGANGGNGANGGSGNNGAGGGKKEYPANVPKPKTLDEYSKIVNDKTIKLEDRLAVTEYWENVQNPQPAN